MGGPLLPGPDSPGALLSKRLSKANTKDTRLSKNDSKSETQLWAGAVGNLGVGQGHHVIAGPRQTQILPQPSCTASHRGGLEGPERSSDMCDQLAT